ncbi:phosphorylase superfamily protein [Fusarium tricinctum]|uniref:Phosphorylase superfamily protein n=1 Tax=Fusarium tricinctum TaxID=61284 RepID=A0A8K0RH90_9HYPO|nr:phosphorylase superfamily protein [Fusarium tricinctum]
MSTISPRPHRPNDRRGFEIAIICALTLEADAIEALFDHHWDDDGPSFDKEPGDPNAYSTGVIGRFNVVLAYMPGMGKVNAATVASNCGKSFPGIKLALVVGICGVIPFGPSNDEIVLGDVIISNGVIQYDFGRQLPDRFVRKNTLLDVPDRPNLEIRGVFAKLTGIRHRRQLSAKIADYLDVLRQDRSLHAEYPGSTEDRLFEASYRHTDDQKSCEQLGCNGQLVSRSRLVNAEVSPTPAIHFGLIASGDAVMKSGKDRDRIAVAEGVIAFEMEGAGVWDSFPCIIIKGACDYADSHKRKVWQRYAAATAAACAKAFLGFWIPSLTQDANSESSCSLGNQGSFGQSRTARAVHERQMQPVFLVPFSKNDYFVGREDVLARLRGLLFEQGRQKVALVGLGGLGKTQVALQLAFWVKENKPDYSVFWMPALSMAGFEQECVKLVRALGIRCSEGDDAKDAVRQHLSSKEAGNWFLIVDNADDVEIFHKLTHSGGGILDFLPSSDNGRTLFTTRSRKVASVVAKTTLETLLPMHQEEATGLLEKSLIDKEELKDIENVSQLLDALTYLPLAIAQAAAYMNVYETPIVEYIRVLKDADADNIIELLKEGYDDEVHYDSSQGAVATTWIVSFDRIRRSVPAAADLLSFMAYIEPKGIPRSILPRLKTEQQMTKAIGILTGHGFLSRRESEATFDMHNLVHLATRRWNENEGREREVRQTALAHVAEVFPTDDWENRDLWRQYLPHALSLLGTTRYMENEGECGLRLLVGQCLLVDGRTTEAVSTLEYLAETRERILAEDHPDRLSSEHELARAYLANGQTKKAIKMLEHVVEIEARILAEDHPDRLISEQVLAGAYLSDGQTKKAVEMLEHVVKLRERILAEDHPHQLASEQELAGAYLADGQTKKAVKMLEYVVEIRKRILAEDHPSQLSSKHELARAYLADGQTKKAVKMLEHVVKLRERILAEDHPSQLTSEHELAGAYLTDGQTKKAVEMLEHVVKLRERILAEDHPHRLTSEHELAGTYLTDGQTKKAVKMLEYVVEIRKRILAEDHPHRLASEHELAGTYLTDGQTKKAIKMLEHVVTVEAGTLAEDHPDRLSSEHELARAYLKDGQTKKAIEMLEHVVKTQKRILAKEHPDRLVSEQTKKAIEMLEHVVAVEAGILAEGDPSRHLSQDLLQYCYERLEGAGAVMESKASVLGKEM